MKAPSRKQRRAQAANVTEIIKDIKSNRRPYDYAKRYVEKFILPHVREGEGDGTQGTPGASSARTAITS